MSTCNRPLFHFVCASHYFFLSNTLVVCLCVVTTFPRWIIGPCTHLHYVFKRLNYESIKIVFLVVTCVGTLSLTTPDAGFSLSFSCFCVVAFIMSECYAKVCLFNLFAGQYCSRSCFKRKNKLRTKKIWNINIHFLCFTFLICSI